MQAMWLLWEGMFLKTTSRGDRTQRYRSVKPCQGQPFGAHVGLRKATAVDLLYRPVGRERERTSHGSPVFQDETHGNAPGRSSPQIYNTDCDRSTDRWNEMKRSNNGETCPQSRIKQQS